MKPFLSKHVNEILKLRIAVHPVDARKNVMFGLCNPVTGAWSVVNGTGLKPSHFKQLDELVPKILENKKPLIVDGKTYGSVEDANADDSVKL